MGAHPFSTGVDECLVHNGSLSNHNNLRRELKREGRIFETENDTEVAAAYLTAQMDKGLSLGDALEKSLDDLDGFYTFVVGTRDGFGVLRDRIACKPAVLAETDRYVAFGSEYRALVGLARHRKRQGLGARTRDRVFLGTLIMPTVDLATTDLRELNQALHELSEGTNETHWEILNPARGSRGRGRRERAGRDRRAGQRRLLLRRHEPAGQDHGARFGRTGRGREHDVRRGHREGRCQPVCRRHRQGRPAGDRGQCLVALRHFDEGHRYRRARATSAICRPSWRRPGNLVVCGDAGDALGDSIYEARLFVRGSVKSLGADCIEKEMRSEHVELLTQLLARASITDVKAERFQALWLGAQALQFQRRSRGRLRLTRPAIPAISIQVNRRPIECPIDNPPTVPRKSATFDDYTLSEIRRAATTGIYDIRGGGREAQAAAFRRSAVSRRIDVALSARRLSRAMRHRCRARHALCQEADASEDSDHHRRHELRFALGAMPRRRWAAARPRRAPRPRPAMAACRPRSAASRRRWSISTCRRATA